MATAKLTANRLHKEEHSLITDPMEQALVIR